MVDRIDVDVVDVQQQVAIGLAQHCIGERHLVHVLLGRGVIRDVFHRQASPENVLGLTNARGDVVHRFFGKRQRQQVVQVTVIAAIAQVLAVQRYVVVIEENPHLLQKPDIQRRRPAQRQGQAVTGQRITLGQTSQRCTMGAADADPVFRRDFEKIEMTGRSRQKVFH
ncbi:hypothetical protein D3C85_624050 [compost metagenome]